MTTRKLCIPVKALMLAAVLSAVTRAQAFNPQPDPPAHLGMVGIVAGQTVRLSVVNVGDPNTGNLGGPDTRVELTFVDLRGGPLAPTVERVVHPGEAIFVDFSLPSNAGAGRLQLRAKVKVIGDPGLGNAKGGDAKPRRGLMSTLEVFDSDSGKTTVFIADPGI